MSYSLAKRTGQTLRIIRTPVNRKRPAKAGAHFSGITWVEAWTPAFAGVTIWENASNERRHLPCADPPTPPAPHSSPRRRPGPLPRHHVGGSIDPGLRRGD